MTFSQTTKSNTKNTFCVSCPLYDRPLVHSEITKPNPQVWFVGEAPGEEEVHKKAPFVGKAGKLLRESLNSIGWDIPYLITNACLCHPENNKTPSIVAIKCCRWHFDILFSKYPPKLIVALGSVAAKALGIPHEKLESLRGMVFSTKYGPCFVMYHPSRVLRSRYRLKSLFLLDLRKALFLSRTAKEIKNALPENQVTVLSKQEDIVNLINSIPLDKPVAFDIETSVPDPETGKWPDWGLDFHHELNSIYSIAFSWDNKAYAFPVDPKTGSFHLEADPTQVKQHLKELFTKHRNLIAHNAKFEIHAIRKHLGVTPKIKHDTMVLAYLINENLQGFYSLKALATVYLPDWSDFKNIKLTNLVQYNGFDALCTLKLFDAFQREITSLSESAHLAKAERFIMNVVLPVVIEMETNGFKVNMPLLYQAGSQLKALKEDIKEKFKELTGVDNPSCFKARDAINKMAQQAGLSLPQTQTGLPELRTATLEEILETTDFDSLKKAVAYKLTYSKIDKLYSTYIQSYYNLINKNTGRIHPVYRPEGTRTGRLSSENPNFQQIPRDGLNLCPSCKVLVKSVCPLCGSSEKQEIVNINKLITAEDGFVIISADYSQIEVRILAHITGDKNLLKAINSGLDLHSYTASQIYGIPYEEIMQKKDVDKTIKALRQSAKSVTFGIIYGITPQGLAAQIGKTPEEANSLINLFYAMYPDVKQWITRTHNFVKQNKWLATQIGRVRHFDLNKETFSKELRESQNFPIQSFASDLTLYAARLLMEKLKPYNAFLIGLVHDSIKVECPIEHKSVATDLIKETMTYDVPTKFSLTVPLEIEIDIYIPEPSEIYIINNSESIEKPQTKSNTKKEKLYAGTLF